MGQSLHRIAAGSRVHLNFSLALGGGEVIDSNFDRPPVAFSMGDGSLPAGFEKLLLGLVPGDEIERELAPAEAFGEVNPDNRQSFPRSQFCALQGDPLVSFAVGSVVSFKDAAGYERPGVIAAIDPDTVLVDFNHPLAGRPVLFKAKIHRVLPADVTAVALSGED